MKKLNRLAIGVTVVMALSFSAGTFAETSYPDQFAVGPNIYHKIFENERLRVSEITFKAGESSAMHTHQYDHMVYILDAGQLTLSYPDGKVSVVDGVVGQTMWLGKETHA